MNKRVITTSLALVLAMTVVLAVGKTTKPEQAAVGDLTVPLDMRIASPRIDVDSEIKVLGSDVSAPALSGQTVAIRVDVDETEIILAPIENSGAKPVDGSIKGLMDSLARVQSALKTLQQTATRTEAVVEALIEKRARQ